MIRKWRNIEITDKKIILLFILLTPLVSLGIEEIAWNERLMSLKPVGILCSYFIVLMLETILMTVMSNVDVAFISTLVLTWIFGLTNHYVLEFRGNAFTASDLFVAKTAMKVVGQYKFTVSRGIVISFILLVAYALVLAKIKRKERNITTRKRIVNVLATMISVSLIVVVINRYKLFEKAGCYIEAWSAAESYAEFSAPVGFWLTWQRMIVKMPDGYNQKEVEERLSLSLKDNIEKKSDAKPSVIVIMNESFSDLHKLGDFKSEDYMEAWNSIEDYVMKGDCYVSVLGGSTCNSEYEFLTGNSMIGFAGFPYQQYDLTGCKSIVDDFKGNGYQTVAFHPFTPGNYNRNKVYPLLGFDEFIYDVEDDESIAWATSDKSDFKKIKEVYENRLGPLFLFNVTMQNHGGYTDDYESLNVDKPVVMGDEYKQYGQATTYLTLVRESANEFKNLVDYFRNEKEPVVLVMFGDHQPFLEDGFIEKIYSKDDTAFSFAKRYTTSYMVWSNYYTQEPEVKDLSINYLSADLMELLGYQDEYMNYMTKLQEDIPSITGWGYISENGEWEFSKEENDLINEYKQVEYYEFKNGSK